MSVLYKALARASKAREAAGDSGGAVARGGSASPGRRRSLRPLIFLILIVVVVGGAYYTVGDEIADTVNVILFGEPSAPQPEASKAPTPAVPAKPLAMAAANPAPSPASPASPATPATTPAAPAPDAATPAAPASPVPVVAPAAPAGPVVSPAPSPKQAAPAPKAGAPGSTKVAAITPEQDLPAILDRIRQERTKTTLEPSAVVDRTRQVSAETPAAPSAVDGMVSVTGETANERDDAERAYDLLLHGQYEGALELYNNVLKIDERSLPALLGKAIALHKLRRFSDALPLYRRVLAIDSDNREALTNMTSIIAAQSPAAALKELREMEKTHPYFSPIPAEIAAIDANGGNMADAISSFNRAIQLSPENGLYRLNLAILQDHAGMARDAAASYQAALERLDDNAQLPLPLDTIRARLRYLRSK